MQTSNFTFNSALKMKHAIYARARFTRAYFYILSFITISTVVWIENLKTINKDNKLTDYACGCHKLYFYSFVM